METEVKGKKKAGEWQSVEDNQIPAFSYYFSFNISRILIKRTIQTLESLEKIVKLGCMLVSPCAVSTFVVVNKIHHNLEVHFT